MFQPKVRKPLSLLIFSLLSPSVVLASPSIALPGGPMDQMEDHIGGQTYFGPCKIQIEMDSDSEARVLLIPERDLSTRDGETKVFYFSNDDQTKMAEGPRTLSFSRSYEPRDLKSLIDWIFPKAERSTLRLRFDAEQTLVHIQALKHWTYTHHPLQQWQKFDSVECPRD